MLLCGYLKSNCPRLFNYKNPQICSGFLDGSDGKESAHNAGDLGPIPGLRRSPGEGNGYTLSILAWTIPWTEEPGRFMGSQRVGHHWETFTFFLSLSRSTVHRISDSGTDWRDLGDKDGFHVPFQICPSTAFQIELEIWTTISYFVHRKSASTWRPRRFSPWNH